MSSLSAPPTSVASALPTLRWGILGTGQISSWLVKDLSLARPDARAHHILQAIGSSSTDKATKFLAEHIPTVSPAPTVYSSYEEVYKDPAVDIIYIGTPTGCHHRNTLDAIAHGKHVLCEKAFAVTAREAREMLAAAEARGVFVMEAMWTRFFPLVTELRRQLYEEKVIGDVHRVFCDLGLDQDLPGQPAESRLRDRNLGAGTLLDTCIYSLTWGLLTLEEPIKDGESATRQEAPVMRATQLLSAQDGIDIASSVLLCYPQHGRQGILTSSAVSKTPYTFCRIEGTRGYVTVQGVAASAPDSFHVYPALSVRNVQTPPEGIRYSFEHVGLGMFYEADAVAEDVHRGRRENGIMSWRETMRVMELMDAVRAQGGLVYPQDDQV